MMREIKFRGFCIERKEMTYGYLVEIQDGRFSIKDTPYNVNNGRINIIPTEVLPESVGQFTGLHDKNGSEIYEGDILKDVFETGKAQIVIYDEDRFIVKGTGVRVSSFASPQFIEVIGNIYENPDLST